MPLVIKRSMLYSLYVILHQLDVLSPQLYFVARSNDSRHVLNVTMTNQPIG